MKTTLTLFASVCVLCSHVSAAEPQFSVVFDGKEGKYEVVRTPQLVVTKAGTLLAFAQGRSGSHDRSDNDIILKRSSDGGETWSPFQVIADQGKDALNSICIVQLRDTGRILVAGCWFPDGYEMVEFQYLSPGMQAYQKKAGRDKIPAIKPGYEGRDIARNYVIHSDDDGRTWSPLVEEKAIQTTPTAAGFIRYSGLGDGAKSRLLFSNPAETKRNRGVISLSYDDGKTWPVQKTLRPGRFKYSALARLPDGSIGCIFDGTTAKGEFENHNGAVILLARFRLDWLTDGKDALP